MGSTAVVPSLSPEQVTACVSLLGKTGRLVESHVQGNSMGRTLPEGCRIRIAPVPLNSLRVGDIVACLDGGFLFAHRMVHRGSSPQSVDYVITQGDGWTLCDAPRHVSTLVGKVNEYYFGGVWQSPAESTGRSHSEQRAAENQVALISRCLEASPRLGQVIARRMLTIYTFRENLRKLVRRFL
jgi:hypothetical protein